MLSLFRGDTVFTRANPDNSDTFLSSSNDDKVGILENYQRCSFTFSSEAEKRNYEAFVSNVLAVAAEMRDSERGREDGEMIAAYQHSITPSASAAAWCPSPMLSQLERAGSLGSGTFGDVQLMRSRLDRRIVALKKIAFRSDQEPWRKDSASFEKTPAIEVLLREVRSLVMCQGSPHVVRYHACWIEPDWDLLAKAAIARHNPSGNSEFLLLDSFSKSVSEESSASYASYASSRNRDEMSNMWPYLLYISMEPVVGITLAEWIHRRNEMAASSSISTVFGETEYLIFEQLLTGIRDVHRDGIIHRDIKPANVILTTDGRRFPFVKIVDFGLSRMEESLKGGTTNTRCDDDAHAQCQERPVIETEEKSGIGPVVPSNMLPSSLIDTSALKTTHIGTRAYCAPELLNTESSKLIDYGLEVDMYALGIILVELCLIFRTDMERAIAIQYARDASRPPSYMADALPRQAALVENLLSKDPRNRFGAQQVLDMLSQAQAAEQQMCR